MKSDSSGIREYRACQFIYFWLKLWWDYYKHTETPAVGDGRDCNAKPESQVALQMHGHCSWSGSRNPTPQIKTGKNIPQKPLSAPVQRRNGLDSVKLAGLTFFGGWIWKLRLQLIPTAGWLYRAYWPGTWKQGFRSGTTLTCYDEEDLPSEAGVFPLSLSSPARRWCDGLSCAPRQSLEIRWSPSMVHM